MSDFAPMPEDPYLSSPYTQAIMLRSRHPRTLSNPTVIYLSKSYAPSPEFPRWVSEEPRRLQSVLDRTSRLIGPSGLAPCWEGLPRPLARGDLRLNHAVWLSDECRSICHLIRLNTIIVGPNVKGSSWDKSIYKISQGQEERGVGFGSNGHLYATVAAVEAHNAGLRLGFRVPGLVAIPASCPRQVVDAFYKAEATATSMGEHSRFHRTLWTALIAPSGLGDSWGLRWSDLHRKHTKALQRGLKAWHKGLRESPLDSLAATDREISTRIVHP